MFSRQRAILRLTQNEGGMISRLRLVKLAFLLSREAGAPSVGVYDFLPYKRGPFSFTLYQDLRGLQRSGWLTEGEHDVSVVETPHLETAFLDKSFLDLIDLISDRYRSVATSALVDHVYSAFPWFTVNSETVHKRAVEKPVARPAIYTVGYEGIMVDGLLDLLLRNGIQRLIDVRSNPIARRYGFHKSTLDRLCEDVGIQYMHIPSLGVPSAWRADLSDQSSYDLLFHRYRTEILPGQNLTVDKVKTLMKELPSALMCMEEDHKFCHRSSLGAKISAMSALPVIELRGK
jgi:uncharacterized protein (DUF488 family)